MPRAQRHMARTLARGQNPEDGHSRGIDPHGRQQTVREANRRRQDPPVPEVSSSSDEAARASQNEVCTGSRQVAQLQARCVILARAKEHWRVRCSVDKDDIHFREHDPLLASIHVIPSLKVRIDPVKSNEDVACLEGEYIEIGEREERNVYQKLPDLGEDIYLYYAGAQDDAELSGWLFANRINGDRVWAKHSESFLEPPRSGWRVPWDGQIQRGLITVAQLEEPTTPSEVSRSSAATLRGGNAHLPQMQKEEGAALTEEQRSIIEETVRIRIQDTQTQMRRKSGGIYPADPAP